MIHSLCQRNLDQTGVFESDFILEMLGFKKIQEEICDQTRRQAYTFCTSV